LAVPKKSRSPQIKITIPEAERADLLLAMKFDGVDKLATFALAAIRQRVRRIKREIEAEKTTPK
jgi:hypothetical protein